METGKVEYAPDYKSNFQAAMDAGLSIAESVIAANRAAAERARLEREVIEKAKAWRHDMTFKSEKPLFAAIEALETFETETIQRASSSADER